MAISVQSEAHNFVKVRKEIARVCFFQQGQSQESILEKSATRVIRRMQTSIVKVFLKIKSLNTAKKAFTQ
ncbi:hypothetical protein ACFTAO_41670 [Paenibacillus rhizoplanae]